MTDVMPDVPQHLPPAGAPVIGKTPPPFEAFQHTNGGHSTPTTATTEGQSNGFEEEDEMVTVDGNQQRSERQQWRESATANGIVESPRVAESDGLAEGDEKMVVPAFDISELMLGRVVGRGGFSVVNDVVNVELKDVYDTGEREAKARAEIAATCREDDEDDEYEATCRYVIKMLRSDLPEDELTKGIVDLAVEARFLSKLAHTNIIAMRGTANSDPLEAKFFVVLDRLVLTLEDRMPWWRKDIGSAIGFWSGPCFGYCCAKKDTLHRIWLDRLAVARDIAGALCYLHDQHIVYRDLKPDNVGFSTDGTVKIFDFGLAKSLYPEDKNAEDLYMLTGNTGSLRYMAPEVARCQPYDARVDVYSFGILFWQLCALATPYAGYTCDMHAEYVVERGYRPKVNSSWPATWAHLMRSCWSTNIAERPNFHYIHRVLEQEIEEMQHEGHDASLRRMRIIKAKKRKKRGPRRFLFFRPRVPVDSERLDADSRLKHARIASGRTPPGVSEMPELRQNKDNAEIV